MNPLEAFCAAGRSLAAADRAFVLATKRTGDLAKAHPPDRPIPRSVTAAWDAKDKASAALSKAERALCRAAIAYDAAIGGGS